MVRELGDPSAGYWQVRARNAEASNIVVEILVGEGQPGCGNRPSSKSLRLEAAVSVTPAANTRRNDEETEAGSQAADLWQRESRPSERQCVEVDQTTIADAGRIVVFRCHAIPQPECAADGDLTSKLWLCQWLRGQHHQTESGSVPASASLYDEIRTGLPTVELVIAYDPGNGHGVWLHRDVAAKAESAPGFGRPELNPAGDPLGLAEGGPPLGGNGRRACHQGTGPDAHDHLRSSGEPENAANATPRSSVDEEPGMAELGPPPVARYSEPSVVAGPPAPGIPGIAASGREHTPSLAADNDRPLFRRLQAETSRTARLSVLRSGLHAAASALPVELKAGHIPPEELLSLLADLPKPDGLWIVAAGNPRYECPADEITILTVSAQPGSPLLREKAAEHRTSQVIYVIDRAVIETLLNAVLAPLGGHGPNYDELISIIKIVIQPRMLVVKIVTMTAGTFLKAHGLGLLGPASGRILTRILVAMLDYLLGDGRRRSRLAWFLNWIEIILYARKPPAAGFACIPQQASGLDNPAVGRRTPPAQAPQQ